MSRLHKYFGVFVSISQGLDTPYIIREDLALSVVHCVEVTQATVMAPTLHGWRQNSPAERWEAAGICVECLANHNNKDIYHMY